MVCEKCGKELADSELNLTEDLIKDIYIAYIMNV